MSEHECTGVLLAIRPTPPVLVGNASYAGGLDARPRPSGDAQGDFDGKLSGAIGLDRMRKLMEWRQSRLSIRRSEPCADAEGTYSSAK